MALHSYRIALGLGAALLLVSCNNVERLKEIGTDPKLDGISRPGEQNPVSVPMPQASGEQRGAGSLWVAGSHAFFRDPRASKVGDIITVDIAIADTAKLSNDTKRTRTNTEAAGVTNMFGAETFLPSFMTPSSLVNDSSSLSNEGTGSINRSEAITMTMAALVTQTLPNGNLVIGGHQQVRVNGELRDLQISGIVRIEDITSDNTVNLTQIAEARISYGGRGTMSDVQSPRWGTQILDAILPW